jgi:hypothetical protein
MSLNSVLVGFFGKPVLALVRLRITTLEGALSQRGPGSSYDPEEDRGAWLQPGGEQRLQPGGEQRLQPGGEQRLQPGGEQRLQPGGEQRLQPGGEQRLQPGDRGAGYNPEGGAGVPS